MKRYGFKTIHRVQLAIIAMGVIAATAFIALATCCKEG